MWQVEATDRFWKWLQAQDEALRLDVLAALKLLAQAGPHLGRPFVDTLMLSRVPNMKELRVQSKGRPIRSFFVSIRAAMRLCCVPATNRVKIKSVSISRCFALPKPNTIII